MAGRGEKVESAAVVRIDAELVVRLQGAWRAATHGRRHEDEAIVQEDHLAHCTQTDLAGPRRKTIAPDQRDIGRCSRPQVQWTAQVRRGCKTQEQAVAVS